MGISGMFQEVGSSWIQQFHPDCVHKWQKVSPCSAQKETVLRRCLLQDDQVILITDQGWQNVKTSPQSA